MDKEIYILAVSVRNGMAIVATDVSVDVGDMVSYAAQAPAEPGTGEVVASIKTTENSDLHGWVRVASGIDLKRVTKVWHLAESAE